MFCVHLPLTRQQVKIKKDTPAVSTTITMISLNPFTADGDRCVLSECMYLYNVSFLHITS